MHWHGLEVPYGNGRLAVYIAKARPSPAAASSTNSRYIRKERISIIRIGAMQEMMGMIGLFILHPEKPYQPRVDHDYGIVLQEWAILPNSTVPNTANMEFNWLTFNGISAPSTTPLIARLGSRVRIRIVNLGMDHHPMHLHGNQFVVTGTEAGRSPESTWRRENTVLVGVAQARDIEFDAKYLGDWMLHCHLPHHMMNSMSDLLADRMITTVATNDTQALSQMQTLANTIGFQHVHHAPIADDANSVAGFPAGRVHGYGHGRSGRQTRNLRPAKELERQHDGHDDAGACLTAGKIRRNHGLEAARLERPAKRKTRARTP